MREEGIEQVLILPFTRELARADPRRSSRGNCWWAGWTRGRCWWATISASATGQAGNVRGAGGIGRAGWVSKPKSCRSVDLPRPRGEQQRHSRADPDRTRFAGRALPATPLRPRGPRGERARHRVQTDRAHAEPGHRRRSDSRAAASTSPAPAISKPGASGTPSPTSATAPLSARATSFPSRLFCSTRPWKRPAPSPAACAWSSSGASATSAQFDSPAGAEGADPERRAHGPTLLPPRQGVDRPAGARHAHRPLPAGRLLDRPDRPDAGRRQRAGDRHGGALAAPARAPHRDGVRRGRRRAPAGCAHRLRGARCSASRTCSSPAACSSSGSQ